MKNFRGIFCCVWNLLPIFFFVSLHSFSSFLHNGGKKKIQKCSVSFQNKDRKWCIYLCKPCAILLSLLTPSPRLHSFVYRDREQRERKRLDMWKPKSYTQQPLMEGKNTVVLMGLSTVVAQRHPGTNSECLLTLWLIIPLCAALQYKPA